ncbi:hypothetical protein CCMA1212_007767 [Trichoderma ghanense]|uniref:Uncharacterized protein n=1 Tax=Trichoderma ghanense TaxID=65468 RepID=A0ABY2GWL3_9HYPO
MPQDNTTTSQAKPQAKNKPSGSLPKTSKTCNLWMLERRVLTESSTAISQVQVPYGIQRFTSECDPWLARGTVVGIATSNQGGRQNAKAKNDDDRSTVATQGSGK